MAKKSTEKKPADKRANGDKKAGKDDEKQTKGKVGGLKPATAVNVRHILCEKHSRATEALQLIQSGQPFDKVAQDYSEDKAKGNAQVTGFKL